MIKPIKQVTSILEMLVFITFVSCHNVSYAEDISELPGMVHIPVKNDSPHSSLSSSTVDRSTIGDVTLTEVEFKLNKAILSLANPGLRKRDVAGGVIIAGLTGLCLAYVPQAEGSNWTNDFWNPCAVTSMSCYALQYVNPHGVKIVDDSIIGIKIDLGTAYGFYIPARLAELKEQYTPDTANVNAVKKKRGKLFKFLNVIAEAGVIGGASIIGYVVGSGYYHDLTSGGYTPAEILPLAVPLGLFLGIESIFPFKSLKNKVFSAYDLREGTDELRAHRLAIIQSLQKAKQAVFKMSDKELKVFRNRMKELSEKAKSGSSIDAGLEQFREILRIGRGEILPEPSSIRRYGPKAAALLTFGTSLYVFYQIFDPKMIDYYDNSSNGKSAYYQMKLKYFEEHAPTPVNDTANYFYEWCQDCFNGIIWSWKNLNETTGEGSGEGSFGYKCAGLPYQDTFIFNLPGDIDISPDVWFQTCAGTRDFIEQYYQGFAGGSSTEITHSAAAKEFGKGAGSIFATMTSILNAYGVHQVSNRLGDLFSDTPVDPQPGQKNKWFNALNLVYSTSQAAVRAAPYGMLAYLALQGDTASLATLGTVALTGKTMNFITYFQERYRTIPGAVQKGWGYAKSLWGKVTGRPVTMPENFIAVRDETLVDLQSLIDLIPQTDKLYIEKMMEIRGEVLAEPTVKAVPSGDSVVLQMNPLMAKRAA